MTTDRKIPWNRALLWLVLPALFLRILSLVLCMDDALVRWPFGDGLSYAKWCAHDLRRRCARRIAPCLLSGALLPLRARRSAERGARLLSRAADPQPAGGQRLGAARLRADLAPLRRTCCMDRGGDAGDLGAGADDGVDARQDRARSLRGGGLWLPGDHSGAAPSRWRSAPYAKLALAWSLRRIALVAARELPPARPRDRRLDALGASSRAWCPPSVRRPDPRRPAHRGCCRA
jgi:hypothetical protein